MCYKIFKKIDEIQKYGSKMKPIPTISAICLAFSHAFTNPISADNIEQLNQQRNDYNLHQESWTDSSHLLDSTNETNSQENANNNKEFKQHNKDATKSKKDNKDSISQDSTMQTTLQNPHNSTTPQASKSQEATQSTKQNLADSTTQFVQQNPATQDMQNPPCFLINYIALSLPPPSTQDLRQKVAKEFAFLRPILTSYQHKCLNTTDIATLLNSLNAKTIKKGYVTTSFALSPQNLNTKKLLITMQTTTIGDIIIDKPKYVRLLRKDYPIKIGDFVNITKIERGLHNYKRLRSISPKIHLQSYLADVSLDSSPPNSLESTLDSSFDSTHSPT